MDQGLAGDTEIASHVMAVLDAPALAHLWNSDALTEVDITAAVNDRRFHGAIDRLIISDTTVLAIDYKSNHTVYCYRSCFDHSSSGIQLSRGSKQCLS